jgi:hypothetical protein
MGDFLVDNAYFVWSVRSSFVLCLLDNIKSDFQTLLMFVCANFLICILHPSLCLHQLYVSLEPF